VTTKSIWLEENIGHKNPTMFGTEHYFLNAVGLSDAGIKKAQEETFPEYLKNKPAPIIANIVAGSMDDFGKLAAEITEVNPDLIEINISCPNVESAHGKPFSCSLGDAAAVTRVCKEAAGKPVIVKLTPNVPNIGEIAKACADAGADGFCAINTLFGMGINTELRRPVLTNKSGGVSGPGIKPVAVKAVYDIYKATGGMPIIGTGGITYGEDAIEIMMAGATLVGMGTMVYYREIEGFGLVVKEMDQWCKKNGVKNIEEIIGAVHN